MGTNIGKQQQQASGPEYTVLAADAGNFIYLEYINIVRQRVMPSSDDTDRATANEYIDLKGADPEVRCGGSFVKGCARITCQGLNRSIADSPKLDKPLLNAQKLNTHKHTSSNIALIIPYNLFG